MVLVTGCCAAENYAAFFDETVRQVEVPMGTDNADLKPFRDAGGKLIMVSPISHL